MINEIVARLKSHATALADVQPAEQLEALSQGTAPRHGAAFVIPFREEGDEQALMSGAFRQEMTVQILVAFVTRRHDDIKGGKKVADWDALRTSIEAALFGWSITPETEPFTLAAARSAPFGNGTSVYVQTWQTNRYLEKP